MFDDVLVDIPCQTPVMEMDISLENNTPSIA